MPATLNALGGCWVNRERGKPPRGVGDEIRDKEAEDVEDSDTDKDEDGTDIDDDKDEDEENECWDPPDPAR